MTSGAKELILSLEESFLRHESQCNQNLKGSMKSSDKYLSINAMADVFTHQYISSFRLNSHYQNLVAIVFERFFKMCSDEAENVKICAEEALNKLIKELLTFDINKIFFEVHKELRKNAEMRSLRAALRIYAGLTHIIPLQFLRFYVKDLDNILIRISKRPEESIQEEIRDCFLKISPDITHFFLLKQTKNLLFNWTDLLKSSSTTTRRMASSLLVSLVSNLKNSTLYHSILLQFALSFVPHGIADSSSILGVLSLLRHLLPSISRLTLDKDKHKSISGSFGKVHSLENEYTVDIDIMRQIFVFCLHCSTHSNHVVSTSSLEALKLFFIYPDSRLISWLLDSGNSSLFKSILLSICIVISDFDSWFSSVCIDVETYASDQRLDYVEEIFQNEDYSDVKLMDQTLETESDSSNSELSESMSKDMRNVYDAGDCTSSDVSILLTEDCNIVETMGSNDFTSLFRDIMDDDYLIEFSDDIQLHFSPLARVIRQICKTFLLSGIPSLLISDDLIRISLKNSALSFISSSVVFDINLLFSLHIYNGCDTNFQTHFQIPADIFLYISHSDPLTVEIIASFVSDLIRINIQRNAGIYQSPENEFFENISLDFLLHSVTKLIQSSDPLLVRAGCYGFSRFIPELVSSCHGEAAVECLQNLFMLRSSTFWMIRLQISKIFASFDLFLISNLLKHFDHFQNDFLYDYIPFVFFDKHPKVKESGNKLVQSVLNQKISFFLDPPTFWLDESFLNDSSIFRISCLERFIYFVHFLFVSQNTLNNFRCACFLLEYIAREYPPSKYPVAWGIIPTEQDLHFSKNYQNFSFGLIHFLFSKMLSPSVMVDLVLHSKCLYLIVSILNAVFHELYQEYFDKGWKSLHMTALQDIPQQLFFHLARVVRIFYCIFSHKKLFSSKEKLKSPEEMKKQINPQFSIRSKSGKSVVLPNSTDNHPGFENFFLKPEMDYSFNELHYSSLYNVIKSSYLSYKQSFSFELKETFCIFLQEVLTTFSELISFSIPSDLYFHLDEILYYLVRILYVDPTSVLNVVRKLICSLHGRKCTDYIFNLVYEKKIDYLTFGKFKFHDSFYLSPVRSISTSFLACKSSSDSYIFQEKLHENLPIQHYFPKKSNLISSRKDSKFNLSSKIAKFKKKSVQRSSSNIFDASVDVLKPEFSTSTISFRDQIKKFEKILTNSLLLYSATTEIFQKELLALLFELVEFKLNYLLIDSNLLFLNKLVKQVEYIEMGLMRNDQSYLKELFQFFITITVHKPDILPLSKVIQLCDSVMASGKSTLHYTIPSLMPLLLYFFPEIIHYQNFSDDNSLFFLTLCLNQRCKVDTGHKDVVISMLIRLIEFPAINFLLSILLHSKKTFDIPYFELSSMIIGPLLQKLKRLQVQLDSSTNFKRTEQLIFALHLNHTSQISLFLKTVHCLKEVHSLEQFRRWFSICIIVLKLSFKVSNQPHLLKTISDITLCTPAIHIFSFINLFENDFDTFLNPEEKLAYYILNIFYKSILILSKMVEWQNTLDDLQFEHSFHLFLLNEFIVFLNWIISDNQFPDISHYVLRIIIGKDYLPIQSLFDRVILFTTFFSLCHQFSHLFFNFFHFVGVRSNPPPYFWLESLQIILKSSEVCDNHIHSSIIQTTFLSCCYSIKSTKFYSVFQNRFFIESILTFYREPAYLNFLAILDKNVELSALVLGSMHNFCLFHVEPFQIRIILNILKSFHHFNLILVVNIYLKLCLKTRHWGVSFNIQRIIMNLLSYSNISHLYSLGKSHTFFLNAISFLKSNKAEILKEISEFFVYVLYPIKLVSNFSSSFKKTHSSFFSISGFSTVPDQIWCFDHFQKLLLDARPSFVFQDFFGFLDKTEFIQSLSINKLDLLLYIIELTNQYLTDMNLLITIPMFKEQNSPILRTYDVCSIRLLVTINDIVCSKFLLSDYIMMMATKCIVALAEKRELFYTSDYFRKFDYTILVKFVFLHLEKFYSVGRVLKTEYALSFLFISIIFEMEQIRNHFVEIYDLLLLGISHLNDFVQYILKFNLFIHKLLTVSSNDFQEKALKILSFLLNNLTFEKLYQFFPQYLIFPMKVFLTSLCQIPCFYDLLIIPDILWDSLWKDEPNRRIGNFPMLDESYLRDPDCFYVILKRLLSLGWRSQDQFEEIWSLIIRVLLPPVNQNLEDFSEEEQLSMIKTSSLAIEGVSSHLYLYLLLPKPGFRHPNFGFDIVDCGDTEFEWSVGYYGHLLNEAIATKLSISNTKMGQKILLLQNIIEDSRIKFSLLKFGIVRFDFDCISEVVRNRNCLIPLDFKGYSINHFFLPPLFHFDDETFLRECLNDNLVLKRDSALNLNDVNLSSCIRLLCDVYQTWLYDYPQKIPIFLFHLALKSLVVISDLFIEKSQFESLFNIFLNIFFNHSFEDEISTQLLILGICKASIIIDRDIVQNGAVFKVFQSCFDTDSRAIHLTTLEGFIILSKTQNIEVLFPIIPTIVDFILESVIENNRSFSLNGQNHQLVVSSVGLTLLEHFPHLIKDSSFVPKFISFLIDICFETLEVCNFNLFHSVITILERLALGLCLQKSERSVIIKLTLKLIGESSISNVLLSSLSLLIVCIYSGEEGDDKFLLRAPSSLSLLENDPMTYNIDIIAQSREKVNVLLKCMYNNNRKDAEVICQVIEYLLIDLLPTNQGLNLIITEFISDRKLHKKYLCLLLHKLFQALHQKGLLDEIKIWGLLCIQSFSQIRPIGFAVWSLFFLFISISFNPWISQLLPFILSKKFMKVSDSDIEAFYISAYSFFHTLEKDEMIQYTSVLSQIEDHHPLFSLLLHFVN